MKDAGKVQSASLESLMHLSRVSEFGSIETFIKIFRIVYTSTQGIASAQTHTALILGVGEHKVNVRVKRVGGAFGGKQISFFNGSQAKS